MTKPLPPEGRLQSSGEEIANSLSSGIGLMAVIAGIPLLVGYVPPPLSCCPRDQEYQEQKVERDAPSNASPARTALPAAHFERNEAPGI